MFLIPVPTVPRTGVRRSGRLVWGGSATLRRVRPHTRTRYARSMRGMVGRCQDYGILLNKLKCSINSTLVLSESAEGGRIEGYHDYGIL